MHSNRVDFILLIKVTDMAKAKLTTRQQLEAILLAEKKLAEKKAALKAKLADLKSDSPGMQALLEVVQSTADLNKVPVADVIKAVAKIKHTGLKIEKVSRKPRASKSGEANS